MPAAGILATGEEWLISNVPPGTAVIVDGDVVEAAIAAEHNEVTLVFEMAADYALEFRPPHPWLDAACAVSVE